MQRSANTTLLSFTNATRSYFSNTLEFAFQPHQSSVQGLATNYHPAYTIFLPNRVVATVY